jgi:hypothetical protein
MMDEEVDEEVMVEEDEEDDDDEDDDLDDYIFRRTSVVIDDDGDTVVTKPLSPPPSRRTEVELTTPKEPDHPPPPPPPPPPTAADLPTLQFSLMPAPLQPRTGARLSNSSTASFSVLSPTLSTCTADSADEPMSLCEETGEDDDDEYRYLYGFHEEEGEEGEEMPPLESLRIGSSDEDTTKRHAMVFEFEAYGLPMEEQEELTPGRKSARNTFGNIVEGGRQVSAMEELMVELGYLGEVID